MKIDRQLQDLWFLARSYYQKGRSMDIAHIEWMMKVALKICEQEKVDQALLLPLVILHDVGYSSLSDPKNANYYDKDIRKAHMAAGADIAENILSQLDYPKEQKKQIVQYISIHDIWAYGEVEPYLQDKILGIFKDLDYLWTYTKEGCRAVQKHLQKSDVEMFTMLDEEISPIYGKKPFSCKATKALREQYIAERKQDLGISLDSIVRTIEVY